VLPDFRAPDNIRLGLAPMYTTFDEIYRAVEMVCEIVDEGLYKEYGDVGATVT
jgi:kynureninase